MNILRIFLCAATCLMLLEYATAQQQDCPHFRRIVNAAAVDWGKGDFDKALNQLNAAREHCPDRSGEVDSLLLVFTRDISRKYEEAEREKNRANKSATANKNAAIALSKAKNDYTLAWHLAVHAWRGTVDEKTGASSEPGVTGIMNQIISDTSAWFGKTLYGHTDEVWSVEFSPDGRYILSSSRDGTARLWTEFGAPVAVLSGHRGPITSAHFSPDGKHIVTSSYDGTARLWDGQGRYLRSFRGHKASVMSAVFSPNNLYVLTGGGDKTARLWGLDGELIQTYEGLDASVSNAVFSPDGDYILGYGRQDFAILWSIQGDIINRLYGHDGRVIAAAFTPDEQKIITITASDHGHKIKYWNRYGDFEKVLETSIGSRSITFDKTGTRVLYDNFLRICNTDDGTYSEQLFDGYGYENMMNNLNLYTQESSRISPDGARAVVTYDNGYALLSDKGFIPLKAHTGPVLDAAFSPESDKLVTAGADHNIRLWYHSGKTFRKIKQAVCRYMAPPPTRNMLYLDGGKSFITHQIGCPMKLFDDAGYLIRKSNDEIGPNEEYILYLFFLSNQLININIPIDPASLTYESFSPDLKKLFFIKDKSQAYFICEDHHKILPVEASGIYSYNFSSNSQFLGLLTDKHVMIFDGKGNQVRVVDHNIQLDKNYDDRIVISTDGQSFYIYVSKPDKGYFFSKSKNGFVEINTQDYYVVRFSNSGDRILLFDYLQNYNQVIQLYDNTGKLHRTLDGHIGGIREGIFSSNGQYILSLSASSDNTARLWDKNGQLIRVLEGHSAPVLDLAFTPDGKYIWTAAKDNTARLWDLNGNNLYTLHHNSPVYQLLQSPDGKNVLTATKDMNAWLWTNFAELLESNWTLPPADLLRARADLNLKLLLDTCNATNLRDIGVYLHGAGSWKEARDFYTAALQKHADVQVLKDLVSVCEQGKLTFDKKLLNRFRTAPELYRLARFFKARQQGALARELYEKGLALDTDGQMLVELYELSQTQGKPLPFERLLRLEHPFDLSRAAWYCMDARQWKQARALYEKALDKSPQPDALEAYYRTCLAGGFPDAFERSVHKMSSADLLYYANHFEETFHSENSGDYGMAQNMLESIPERFDVSDIKWFIHEVQESRLEREPMVTAVCTELARRCLLRGRPEVAENVLNSALLLYPDNKELRKNLPHALLLQGQVAAAEQEYLLLADQPFRTSTFRSAFLADFAAFRKKMPRAPLEDLARMEALLK